MLHSNLKSLHHNQQHECQTNILLRSYIVVLLETIKYLVQRMDSGKRRRLVRLAPGSSLPDNRITRVQYHYHDLQTNSCNPNFVYRMLLQLTSVAVLTKRASRKSVCLSGSRQYLFNRFYFTCSLQTMKYAPK